MSGPLRLDHLVIGAATLAAGIAHIRDVLGIEMPPGGKHPLMGTHNRLLRIGAGVFLEIIAIDPEAPDPGRKRWFALDDPGQRRRIAERPRLIAWVAGTDDLDRGLATLQDLGRAIPASRGNLSWRIGIRDDGALPEAGMLPVLIEWPAGPHPAERMTDLGIRLEHFAIGHPEPDRLRRMLARIGGDRLADFTQAERPGLSAEFRRADGQTARIAS